MLAKTDVGPGALSAFVSDQQERTVYIKEKPGIHPALRFCYRSIGVPGRVAWNTARAQQMTPEDRIDFECRTLINAMTDWSLSRTIDMKNVRDLEDTLWMRMIDIVCWGGDPDPDPANPKAKPLSDPQFEAQNAKN